MGVVDQEITAQSTSGVVVDAAGTVCDVPHDEGFNAGTEGGQDVGDRGCEEEEAFGELEGDFGSGGGADPVDRFGDFKGIVGGEEGDGGVDFGVVEDFGRDLVEDSGWAFGLRDCGQRG